MRTLWTMMLTGMAILAGSSADTKSFANVPLWYAQYNYRTSLSDWPTEHFGGWAKPVAKQFATKALCGVGGPDWDVMQILASPTVIVDRTLPPDTKLPPLAPGGLYPADGAVVPPDYVKLMSATIPRARVRTRRRYRTRLPPACRAPSPPTVELASRPPA